MSRPLRLLVFLWGATISLSAICDDRDPCVREKFDWRCFGTIEARFKDKKNTDEYVKTIRFSNKEFLLEFEKSGVKKRAVFLPSNNLILFSPLEPGETIQSRTEFFTGWAMALRVAIPMDAFRKAFPDGINSVPSTQIETSVPYLIQPLDKPSKLATIRTGSIINFKITNPDSESDAEISGIWDSQQPDPLPDDYVLTGWVHQGDKVVKNLRQARQAPKVLQIP